METLNLCSNAFNPNELFVGVFLYDQQPISRRR